MFALPPPKRAVIDKEVYANIVGSLVAVVDVVVVALFVIKLEATLTVVGLVMLVDSCLFFLLNIMISTKMGWIAKFKHGLFGKFTNIKVFTDVVKTAAVSRHSGDYIVTHSLIMSFNIQYSNDCRSTHPIGNLPKIHTKPASGVWQPFGVGNIDDLCSGTGAGGGGGMGRLGILLGVSVRLFRVTEFRYASF